MNHHLTLNGINNTQTTTCLHTKRTLKGMHNSKRMSCDCIQEMHSCFKPFHIEKKSYLHMVGGTTHVQYSVLYKFN